MFRRLILPTSSTRCIHPRYVQYVGWTFTSNFFASVESVLATHSMLAAVSSASASAIAISSNYIGKDIVGQLASVAFINKTASESDKDPIHFMKRSNLVQQVSTFAECATPLLPFQAFIPIAAIANVGKCVSFAGFGAINASVIRKLATDENIGEIYSKVCIANTISSTAGMVFGLALASAIPCHVARLSLVPMVGAVRYLTYRKSIEGLVSCAAPSNPKDVQTKSDGDNRENFPSDDCNWNHSDKR
jgi:hypothetical protein